MESTKKLIDIGSDALTAEFPVLQDEFTQIAEQLKTEIQWLLSRKNGFYAFESALLVRPTVAVDPIDGISEWNRADGWRKYYDIDDDVVFFAEDAFAGQFGVSPTAVVKLGVEDGGLSVFASSIEDWAEKVLDDYDFETGWSLAKAWQHQNHVLRQGTRLLPKVPFVLGGDYSVENLVEVDSRVAMRKLGSLYRQIKDVPDGEQITVRDWIV